MKIKKIKQKIKTPQKMNEKDLEKQGSFVGHLSELRSRIIKSFVFLLIAFIISYIFSEDIYKFLVQPYSDAVNSSNLDRRLIFTALQEAFLTYLKVAFFTSLFITSPIFLTQIWTEVFCFRNNRNNIGCI